MAKTKIDFKSLDIPAAVKSPIYAGVGAGDLAVTAAKEYVADVQKSVNDFSAKKLADSALARAAARRTAVENRVADLQAEALALPGKGQDVVLDYVEAVTDTYAELANRGEAVVRGTKLLSTATLEVKVNTTNPAAKKNTRKPAVKRATPVTSTTTKTTTKTTVKPTAKKAPVTKTSAAKAPVRKTSAAKAPVKTTPTATKSTTTASKTTTPASKPAATKAAPSTSSTTSTTSSTSRS